MESLVVAAEASAPTEFAPPPNVIAVAMAKERELLLRDIGTGIKLTKAQKKILAAAATHDDVDILPTGEIYVSGDKWRARLNDAFDPMGWGFRPGQIHQHFHEKEDKCVLYREIFLVVSRCDECWKSISACSCTGQLSAKAVCVSTAIGAQQFHPKNARMTLDDAAEAATTNGIMRCCKPHGLFANIWDRRWAEEAKLALGIKVQVADWRNNIRDFWRRLDRRPLPGEVGLADGSPNAEQYVAPSVPAPSGRKAAPPRQPPPQTAQSDAPAPKTDGLPPGHGLKTIRVAMNGEEKVWVVSTDRGDLLTADPKTMLSLEHAKANGQRVHFTTEVKPTVRGSRNWIVEFKVIKQ